MQQNRGSGFPDWNHSLWDCLPSMGFPRYLDSSVAEWTHVDVDQWVQWSVVESAQHKPTRVLVGMLLSGYPMLIRIMDCLGLDP